MIDKMYGAYVVICDMCGEELKDCISFEEARERMITCGWKSFKINDIWLNVCPDCKEAI